MGRHPPPGKKPLQADTPLPWQPLQGTVRILLERILVISFVRICLVMIIKWFSLSYALLFRTSMKETIHIISFEPINKRGTIKSIHELSLISLWMHVIGTFWWAKTRELYYIVWFASQSVTEVVGTMKYYRQKDILCISIQKPNFVIILGTC